MDGPKKIILSVDTGSSGTKFSWDDGDRPQFEIMSPWCSEVSEATARSKSMLSNDELPGLESSWVSDLDGIYLLGLSAKRYFGSGFENGERKFKKALYKILGILGYISTLYSEPLEIDLGVLLPFSEYATKTQLIAELDAAIKTGFMFCDRCPQVSLTKIAIYPEGAGTYLQGIKDEVDKTSLIASLVIGHRNASWLTAKGGRPEEKQSKTNDLGFRWVAEEMMARCGYTDEIELTQLISNGIDLPPDIEETLPEVLEQYWKQLSGWLDRQARVSHVVASGGTAIYLKKRLTEKYRAKPRISWADDLSREVSSCGIRDKVLIRRLTDCYGVLKTLGGGVRAEVAA